ncbi:tetratricopeptide repeat protein [Dactylosporangium sp. AC04546]|uniref:tetratricopeptide repeat protein n=1 Tax=Dactylosporangium sp. AC04546 TaxID=2862460 RepID=UPI001EE0CC2D|nr:tetratricopeptide repeat protein [Dactylosporangium sp. AC04546]WVK79943.1 tetratricopeptide repeat protein [Dactylosporangium sp. AC04546]
MTDADGVDDVAALDALEALLASAGNPDAEEPDAAVLRQLSGLADDLDDEALAIALAAAAVRADPDDAEACHGYALLLARRHRLRAALDVLAKLPAGAGRDPWPLTDAFRARGLPILALDHGGYLGRPERLRLWLAGGVFGRARRRRAEQAIVDALPADPLPAVVPPVPALLARAADLAAHHRHRPSASPDTPVAVRARAAELELGLPDAAAALLRTAHRADPDDLPTVLALLRALYWRYRDSLALIDALPPADRRHEAVRSAEADIRARMGLPATALAALGDRRALDGWDRRVHRRLWWRTGGPLWFVRRRMLRHEEQVVADWEWRALRLAAFDAPGWPADFDPAPIRAVLEGLHLTWARSVASWWRREYVAGRATTWTGLAAAGATLTAVARALFSTGWVPAAGLGAATAAVVVLVWRQPFRRLITGAGVAAMLVRAVPACLVVGAAGLLAWRAGGAWPRFGGAALLTLVGLALLRTAIVGPVRLAGAYRDSRLWRYNPREEIIDELLDVLHGVAEPAARADLARRRSWILSLERAATRVEGGFLAGFGLRGTATATWAADRAAGAAAGLRRLQRQVLVPAGGTWSMLARTLRREIVALATGNLADLVRAAPPAAPPAPAPGRRATALRVARSVLFAALPLAAVFAAQPVLHLDKEILSWAKVVALAWALLYLVFTFDQTLRDKIEMAWGAAGAFRPPRHDDLPAADRARP